MLRLITYIGFLTTAYCFLCEQCICTPWMNTLSCTGPNVTQFPYIVKGDWIGHIDIIDTAFTWLPNFNKSFYPLLYTLDIRGNRDLNCLYVGDLQESRNDLIILTDCDAREPVSSNGWIKCEVEHLEWINMLALVPVLALVVMYGKAKFRIKQLLDTNILNSLDTSDSIQYEDNIQKALNAMA